MPGVTFCSVGMRYKLISSPLLTRLNGKGCAVRFLGQSNWAGFPHPLENLLLCLSSYGTYSTRNVSEI